MDGIFPAVMSNKKLDFAKYKETLDYTFPFYRFLRFQNCMFIFPHPDDEIVRVGTSAQLKEYGWTVNLLTFTQGQPGEREKKN